MPPSRSNLAFKRWGPTLLMMALIFSFSSLPGDDVALVSQPFQASAQPLVTNLNASLPSSAQVKPDWLKIAHVIGYAGLGLAFRHGWKFSIKDKQGWAFWLAIAGCLLYSLTDEFHQSFVPGRSASFKDVGLDTLASSAALFLQSVLIRLRRSR